MVLFLLLGMPVLITLSLWPVKNIRHVGWLNAIGYLVALGVGTNILMQTGVARQIIAYNNFFYLDPLSGFFVFTILLIALMSALYSIEYLAHDLSAGRITARKAKIYYGLFNAFVLSMLLVVCVNNLGIMWVGIELTTLVSSFLVGFYNTQSSVEAAWKYLIICSVGIIFALLGTILFIFTLSLDCGLRTLNWTEIMRVAGLLDPAMIKIAFIFILVGYGTKAGFVPMHTWLPDAHSQAVSPISALLSGVLLKTSVYAILRFALIMSRAGEGAYVSHLLLGFGLVSVAVAAIFILVQKELKRLLAYSSIEHLGIIALAFGLGGSWGIIGGLLHILNHALTKSLMFFCAGSIVRKYQAQLFSSISGVLCSLPLIGPLTLLGTLALSGFPPFSIFMSELLILMAAFINGSFLVGGLLLGLLVIAFAGMLFQMSKILFGLPPANMVPERPALSEVLALSLPVILIVVFGLFIPWPFTQVLGSLVEQLKGI